MTTLRGRKFGGKPTPSVMQNDSSGINIAVVGSAADGASPGTDMERELADVVVTDRADGGRWVKASDFDDLAAEFGCFVGELARDFAPRGIGNGFSQVVIGLQALDVQVFHPDEGTILGDAGGELVGKVGSFGCDALMESRQAQASLFAAVAALFAPCQLAGQALDAFLRLPQVLGGSDLLAFRCGNQAG